MDPQTGMDSTPMYKVAFAIREPGTPFHDVEVYCFDDWKQAQLCAQTLIRSRVDTTISLAQSRLRFELLKRRHQPPDVRGAYERAQTALMNRDRVIKRDAMWCSKLRRVEWGGSTESVIDVAYCVYVKQYRFYITCTPDTVPPKSIKDLRGLLELSSD